MVQSAASDQIGINVESVALLRLALPEENIARVFEQMRAERRQYAARFEAEGEQQAAAIRSATDLEKAQILAQAQETAAKTKAEADAEAARTYASVHSLDPDFYEFLRSLEALEAILSENATLVVDTEAAPFNVLEE
jgi:membrane protease subunit HflC